MPPLETAWLSDQVSQPLSASAAPAWISAHVNAVGRLLDGRIFLPHFFVPPRHRGMLSLCRASILNACSIPYERFDNVSNELVSESKSKTNGRVDVDVPAGLVTVGEAVIDLRPHHAGVGVEFGREMPIEQS
jgi:hypothetical protein